MGSQYSVTWKYSVLPNERLDWKCMLEFRRKTYNDLHPGVKNELGFTYQPRVTYAN